MTERLCVPVTHSQLARHLNCAASGACPSASRAPNSASTLTPLFTFVAFVSVALLILFLLVLNRFPLGPGCGEIFPAGRPPQPRSLSEITLALSLCRVWV